MSRINQLLLLLFSTLISFQVSAQKLSVMGKITDSKTGTALDGASVRLKSSGTGTASGSDGTFKIDANANDVLEVSSIVTCRNQ
jgi:iron complex outermembrane receptor protein